MTSDLSLVADVGGTNTRVALAEGAAIRTGSIRRFRNAEHASLEAVLRAYLAAEGGIACRGAAAAIAGPVSGGRGRLTNLDWSFDTETLAAATGAETAVLLNDLQAQGYAMGMIAAENLRWVHGPALPDKGRAKLVIGVGTGCNIAPVFETPKGRFVPASETGHTDLPVNSEADLRMKVFLDATRDTAEVESVLSGRGIGQAYAWHCHEAGVAAEKDAAGIMAACAEGDPLARAAVATAVRMLGGVAGNLALSYLPFDGIFLIGGVARALSEYFGDFDFTSAFHDRGRFSGFMDQFSVAVVTDDFAALTGLAAHLVSLG